MADKSGLKPRGADIQLAAIALPQRLRGEIENAADFRLGDALRGKHLDDTTVGWTGVMPGTTAGSMQVFHGRREKPSCSFGRQEKNLRVRVHAGLLRAALLAWPIPPSTPAA
ncbi:hypothetical protein [Rhizobium ruizarguesonis]|uniref:hypothetical protein n=1 Tax=Rhizobium ruizarguesonis TaxID=2081791 RepID=UPI00371D3D49